MQFRDTQSRRCDPVFGGKRYSRANVTQRIPQMEAYHYFREWRHPYMWEVAIASDRYSGQKVSFLRILGNYVSICRKVMLETAENQKAEQIKQVRAQETEVFYFLCLRARF